MIEAQKKLSSEVKSELISTKKDFAQTQDLIIEHIDDAKAVDERLERIISQIIVKS